MQGNTDAVFEAALKLSDEERFLLVSRLLDVMPPDDSGLSIDDPEFFEELDRRAVDRSGEISWTDLRSEGRGP